MTVIIIGLGSMGRRRLRLLRENFPEISVYGVDQSADRCQKAKDEFNIETYLSVEEVVSKYTISCVFVCTSPLSHASIISLCLKYSINVFTEINVVSDKYSENMEEAKDKNVILFLSSTPLYRSEINIITEKIHASRMKLFYTYHVGQYLPDWHPWEKITDFFVSDRRTNGCRELFAIELPWIIKAFGRIKDIKVHKDNFSTLNLGYPDTYLVTLEHENGHTGQICMDVVTKIPARHLEVFGEDIQIEWRGTPETLWIADEALKNMQQIKNMENIKRENGYREFIVENAYLEEIKEFFAVCNGKVHSRYTFTEDLYTLNMIDVIER
jgi:predicted dehydrogenase